MSALFKKVKAPTAPDPVATANAQGTWNTNTAIQNAELNRVDQNNPYGSVTWTQNGTNPDGTPRYVQNVNYNAQQQGVVDNATRVANAMSGNASTLAGNVDTSAWNTSGFTPFQTGASSSGPIQYGYNSGGTIKDNIDSAGNIQDTYGSGGAIQKGLDYSGVSKLAGNDDFGAETKRAQDAVYNQATSRLDPQFEAEARKYAASLAGKGVSENSAAYTRAMDDFTRRRTDAYNQANFSSIGAGSQEAGRLFGQSLSARQQGVSEVNSQGAFANSAQAQAEAQNAARAQFGNTAQGQRWDQNAQQATFGNAAQSMRNEQNAAAAGFNNQAQGQDFGQSATNVGINNAVRNAQVGEYAQGREEGINRVGAALGAGGTPAPLDFNDYAKTDVANTDYMGAVNNNYNAAMQKYTADKAAQSAAWGAVAGVAGSAVSAFTGKPKAA